MPDAFSLNHSAHPLDPNPEAAPLFKSTGGLQGKSSTVWLGYLMALMITGIMACCILLGVKRKDQIGPYLPWISGAFVMVALVFSALTYSYSLYTNGQSEAFFGGYPVPTAWMIYGIWFLPLGVIAIFIVTFDQWFLKPEDLAAFRQLVQAPAGEEGGTS